MTKARDLSLAAKAPIASPSFTGNVNVAGEQLKLTGSSSQTYVAALNTGSGEAGFYMDASNGDLSGSDYAWIKQKNNLDVEIGSASLTNRHILFSPDGSEKMRIHANGIVTKPFQPSFRAYMAQNAFTLAADTKFPYNATEHNIGNYFNTSTNTFTAPVAGSYFFHFYTIVQAAVTNGHFAFTISGSSISKGKNVHFSKANTGWNAVHHSGVFKLSTGTTVSVFNHSASQQIHGNSWTSFSGYLIG